MTNENDLTDQELDALEEWRKVVEDKYDKLELLRRALNSSHVEKMYVIKRTSSLGPTCPYYLKARKLFIEGQPDVPGEAEILSLLESVLNEFSPKEESSLKEFTDV